jgi:hypothetical protein
MPKRRVRHAFQHHPSQQFKNNDQKLIMKSTKLLTIIPLLATLVLPCLSQPKPEMRMADKVRIREAVNISKLYGEKIWTGVNGAPFAIDLVTDSLEFLINHPSPSEDFTTLGYDSALASQVYYRKAVFNKHFLATFPAVGGVNTIVMGTPENTGKNSSEWIITLLHEHFHQYVNASPGYYAAVNELDLAGGDRTGMWMLNYPFPYADTAIGLQYKNYTTALSKALSAINSDSFDVSFKAYATERNRFRQLLKPADYRYFSFQIWQEGLARYTEYKFLELLDDYEPSKEVRTLPDFLPFKTLRQLLYKNELRCITQWSLVQHQRECFYALGFGEGLLLDRLDSNWRSKYLTDKFYIERYSASFTR